MDLFKNLKKLQKIEPDANYTLKSKQIILNAKLKFSPSSTIWQILRRSLESGVSVALVGVFLVLLLGSFSFFKFLAPFQAQNFDSSSLIAEAQNIDIQIQLADLQYTQTFKKTLSEKPSTTPKESTPNFIQKPKIDGTTTEKNTPTISNLPNEPKETELIEKAIEKLLE